MEMKQQYPVNSTRKFCFYKIEWKIRNYFAAISREKWVINSPVFAVKGNYSTKWQFSLKCNNIDQDTSVSVYLEMLECKPQMNSLWVSCKFVFSCTEEEFSFDIDFGVKEKKWFGVIRDTDILKSLLQGTSDTFIIRCLMFIYDKENNMYDRPKDLGLKSLSQDFCILYKINTTYDLNLLIGGFPVKAHKAILYARNEKLKSEIENGSFIINLPDLNSDAAMKVFGYLYTGNLDYVLRNPSLAVLNCITFFGIKELEIYYEPVDLTLYSEFRVKMCTFAWIIPYDEITDVDTVKKSLVKDKYVEGNHFRLHLYPKCYSGNKDYMSMFIEMIEGCFSRNLYLELDVFDFRDDNKFSRKVCFDPCMDVRFKKIFPRECLYGRSLTDGRKLKIVCRFRMAISGSEILCVIQNNCPSTVSVDTELHYNLLSSQISTLFETGFYSDFILKCEDESFAVHSFILSARSHVFKQLFKRTLYSRSIKFLEIPNMRSNVLRVLLYYMYTGKIPSYEFDDVLDIYRAAQRFCILPLKYRCSSILQENIDLLNVRNVLNLAEKNKDYKLKASLYKFVCSRASEYLEDIADLHIEK